MDNFYRVDYKIKEISATFTDSLSNILKITGVKDKFHYYKITVELIF